MLHLCILSPECCSSWGQDVSERAGARRRRSSELAFVQGCPAGKGGPGCFGRPGLDMEDKTCLTT